MVRRDILKSSKVYKAREWNAEACFPEDRGWVLLVVMGRGWGSQLCWSCSKQETRVENSNESPFTSQWFPLKKYSTLLWQGRDHGQERRVTRTRLIHCICDVLTPEIFSKFGKLHCVSCGCGGLYLCSSEWLKWLGVKDGSAVRCTSWSSKDPRFSSQNRLLEALGSRHTWWAFIYSVKKLIYIE